jgi:hypothetical protein
MKMDSEILFEYRIRKINDKKFVIDVRYGQISPWHVALSMNSREEADQMAREFDISMGAR